MQVKVVGAALALMIGSAEAAKVTPVKGTVLVNLGAGYQRIEAEVDLKPGDSVIAQPHGQAALIYQDSCTVDVVPGMVVWVEATSPCANTTRRAGETDLKLTPTRHFDRAWLIDGAQLIRRDRHPAGP